MAVSNECCRHATSASGTSLQFAAPLYKNRVLIRDPANTYSFRRVPAGDALLRGTLFALKWFQSLTKTPESEVSR